MHEAWPKAHHRAPPDLAIRQRQLCSGARPSAQPYVACATRSESLPITSRAGNDRNASPGELDFMHGRMTSRHEGCVSTMLTESGLSIALPVRHFKGLVRRNGGCKPTSTAFRVLSVLTTCGRVRLQRGVTRRSNRRGVCTAARAMGCRGAAARETGNALGVMLRVPPPENRSAGRGSSRRGRWAFL